MSIRKIVGAVLSLVLFATVSIAKAEVVIVNGLQDQVGYGIQAGGSISLNFGSSQPARVKVVVASVMQPTVEYRYQPNASL